MTIVVVVMEPGSDWPGHTGESTTVVASSAGADDLHHRTRETLRTLHGRGKAVRVAVLACSPAVGHGTESRRPELARVLLDAVKRSTRGRLILSSNGHAPHEAREELFALAGALTDELRGTSATVVLQFTDSSHASADRTAGAGRTTADRIEA